MAFQYGLCYIGSRLLLFVFYPGAGWNFLLLYPEGFLQRGDAVSGFWCAGHSFEGFCLVLLERAKQDFHFTPFTKILTVFSVWRYNLCIRQKIVLLTRELINLFWYCLQSSVFQQMMTGWCFPILFCSFLVVSNMITHLHNETLSQLDLLSGFK